MEVRATALPGVLVIEPAVYRDDRGWFVETYHAQRYAAAGIPDRFVQDNQSRSCRGTVRGLHAQRRLPQGKLVRVLSGTVLDVVVDIRRGSPTFTRWVGVELSAESFRQCWVPAGFAHGFCVLSDWAELAYKCTEFYDPRDELRLRWDDPAIGVAWPIEHPLLSEKDRTAPLLADVLDLLPAYDG